MKWFVLLALGLAPSFVHAQEFVSDFSDQNFCEFDLGRLPLVVDETEACTSYTPYARITEFNDKSFVEITLSSTVPFNEKYRYKMELSVPDAFRYIDQNRTEHEFSIVVPKLPETPKFFNYLSENATAFVLAQWHAANGNSPPIAIRLLNSKELIITIDIDKPGDEDTERLTLWRGRVDENREMHFEVVAHWHPAQGFLDIELNDKKIVGYMGPLGQKMLVAPSYYFKYGLYNSYKNKMPEDFRFTVLLGDYRQTVIF